MAASLDIVIVNWNAGALLSECLRSLSAAESPAFVLRRVVVVDNASTDGSANNLAFPNLPLVIVRNPTNRGFAAGCNQGAADSAADYLLFLNPDMRLQANSLARPLAYLEASANQTVGIVGIQLLDETGAISRSCARFPRPAHFYTKMLALDKIWPARFPGQTMHEWDHRETRAVDQVIGAFFLTRRALFAELGGFDERFFVYFEEVDFALRARRRGHASVFLADAQAVHKGCGTTDQIKATRLFYSLRARILYGYKHFGTGAATMLTLATLLLEPLARLGLAAAQRSWAQIGETLGGYGKLWRTLPQWLPGRKSNAGVQDGNKL